MIKFLNSNITDIRGGIGNRLLERRCICDNTKRIIEREIWRYYRNGERMIYYVSYSHGMEALKFYNNSNEKAVRIEFIKDNDFKYGRTIYGATYKVNEIDAEGHKLIKKILDQLNNDKDVDFKELYDNF